MRTLTDRRRRRLRVLFSNLAEGERESEEIGRLEAQIRTDYHGRFLIELIQNGVDPACKAGIPEAQLLIVRTAELLAVLNQGAPFDEAGIAAIISLGLSPKRPDEAIGNKGVGFKSVFEVASAAELYSVGALGQDLRREPATRLRLSLAPAAEQPGLVAEALSLLREDAAQERAVAQRHGSAEGAVRSTLAHTPGWRYPAPLDNDAWSRRARQLGLGVKDRGRYQTAVVLQLAPGACDAVDRALGELVAQGQEAHLFLPGVRRVEVREAGTVTTLEREDSWTDTARGLAVRRLSTSVRGGAAQERMFWLACRTLSGPEVNAAAASLPGEGWAEVQQATVSIALPVPAPDTALLADGRYHVGLPTRDPTGSPFRVDARFHATLSRTALDRRDNPYNALLDQAAADLAADLVRRLRDAEPGDGLLLELEAARRAVTLALASGPGGFGVAVRARLAGEPVVLLLDGRSYGAPEDCRRLDTPEVDLFNQIDRVLGAEVWSIAGLRLIETPLENAARSLLEELCVPALRPEELLARVGASSVIERLAGALPRQDGEGWSALLDWLTTRLPLEGQDQRVLPVIGGRLVTPQDRPFVPPLARPPVGELRADEIPETLLASLDLLDPTVVKDVDLRRRLVEGVRPLARRPTHLEILSGAVLPALEDAAKAGREEEARALLGLGLGLLGHAGRAEDVSALPWWVPCTSGWRRAENAYLGDAWDMARPEPEDGEDPPPPCVVEQVYGPEGRCVVPWWGEARERGAVKAALTRIGVAEVPRVLEMPRVERVIWGDYHQGHWQPCTLPAGVPLQRWQIWSRAVIEAAAPRVDWGPRTWWHIDDVSWIDGLERPEAALPLAGWVLGLYSYRPARLVPDRERPNRWERAIELGQPWLHLIRGLTEPFVPSHPRCALGGALARPAELCRPPSSLHFAWLPRPAEGLSDALLDAVGVRKLEEMPLSWLLDQIDRFCQHLGEIRGPSLIARQLWSLLAGRMVQDALPPLDGRRLPLWRDGEIVAVAADEIVSITLIDDAYAAEVLGPALDGALLLEPEAEDWSALIARLQDRLPGARIRAVSGISIPYSAAPDLPVRELLHTLAAEGEASALRALAALVRVARPGVTDKAKDRVWGELRGARVQLGALPDDAPASVWDRAGRLLLCQDLPLSGLMAAIWPVLGAPWREDLLALGDAMTRGERGIRDLLRHRKIREELVEDAATRCGLDELLGVAVAPVPGVTSPTRGSAAPARPTARPAPEAAGDEPEPNLERMIQAVLHARTPPLPAQTPTPVAAIVTPRRGPARARRGDEDHTREIGHLGEVFAFRALSAQLPGFDADCWVSSSRRYLDLPGGDDTLGYDFRYVDTDGRLSGRAGATCYIDVKANGGALKGRFSVSSNEWRLAERCSASATEVFIVLRVFAIASEPKLGPIYVDPVAEVQAGRLALAPKDGWWATAVADAESNGDEEGDS